jgi:hypothetical protein
MDPSIAADTIEDAIIELNSVYWNSDSQMHRASIQGLIDRLYSLKAHFENQLYDPEFE